MRNLHAGSAARCDRRRRAALGATARVPLPTTSSERRQLGHGSPTRACCGLLQISLDEVRHRFGDAIAQDVIRCAKELDTYDASRRIGATKCQIVQLAPARRLGPSYLFE